MTSFPTRGVVSIRPSTGGPELMLTIVGVVTSEADNGAIEHDYIVSTGDGRLYNLREYTEAGYDDLNVQVVLS